MTKTITACCIVKNEERFIWYAISSVIDFVDKVLVFDTGSEDKTVEIIKTFKNKEIVFEEKGEVDARGLTDLRKEQLKKIKTDWLMILDGDEIWPKAQLKRMIKAVNHCQGKTIALVNWTRNCVGDVFHYLPKEAGEYQILGKKGHLNIRFIKKVNGLDVIGKYPLESFTFEGKPIQEQENRLEFIDAWYLHTTHLPRSTSLRIDKKVLNREKKYKREIGIKMKKEELPEVFFEKRPKIVPSPFDGYDLWDKILAHILTPMRRLRRRIASF